MSDQFTPLHRPVAEAEGNNKVKALCNRLEILGIFIAVIGLFVSLGSIEVVVGLLGLAISGLARSKRFVCWVGRRGLEQPEPRPRTFFND